MAPLNYNASAMKETANAGEWENKHGQELQKVVNSFCIDDLYHLGFSFTVADPAQPDCPLVACSNGFTELTGYSSQEALGRNCRFLLNGVPEEQIEAETRVKCRKFCAATAQGEEYSGDVDNLPTGLEKPWVELPKGEMVCFHTNAMKSGELFRNMFYLKQVELDEEPFILGVQVGVPEEFGLDPSTIDRRCQVAYQHLEANMTTIEHIMAQQFWYSAQMRRQIAPA